MLSKKQGEILDIIINYIEEEKISPTIREIGELANLSSTSTVHGYLKRLEQRGYISRSNDCPRSIRVIYRKNKEILFGDRIKTLRENAGMTKAELGIRIGVSDRTLGYYESNEMLPRKEETLVKLAETFHLSLDKLLNGNDEHCEEENQLNKYGEVKYKEALHGIRALERVFTEGVVSEEEKEEILRVVNVIYFDAKNKR
ncbi:LexA family protein [Clostridium culturomicium]|uniref:LexA family protein n=1 Tax=Clostridium culturomicium TaxID=1499683 RepID=UPI0009DE9B70|nr:helix-turn-helix domain-containing protein [Clostridium culturomicium]